MVGWRWSAAKVRTRASGSSEPYSDGAFCWGLEFLVAADIIRTVAVQPSLENVARLRTDRADQDVPELLAEGRDRWPLAVAPRYARSVTVVDRIARYERARRLVS